MIIILLFEKGDPLQVPNYRPISLTNNDYKILVYILADRLSSCLLDIIHPLQTAYMHERFIGTNICAVQDWIDYLWESQSSGIVIFLDFQKVFDSVSHKFLFMLLQQMGFPTNYISWIKTLYRDAMSCVQFRNWLTPPFI